ncbi:MAG TPA: hypothetical protein VE223_07140, partial [Nitrososphaeraceae archaeon]|nr:hypothetical protein [Nitrososphaeraceae archaeon]
IAGAKIDYFHLSIEDYGAPSLKALDNAVNQTSRQRQWKSVQWWYLQVVNEGLELYLLLIKKRTVLNAYQSITRLRKIRGESIQSKDRENSLFDYENISGVKDHHHHQLKIIIIPTLND